ncbi:MAG TPA: hypothetical protein VGB32_12585 [Candidatus Bathyarchaeia archaeon]
MDADKSGLLVWEKRVPILTNRYMLWDIFRLFAATGVIMNLLLDAMTLFEEVWSFFTLSLIGLGIVFTIFILVTIVVFRNHFDLTFILGPEGPFSAVDNRTRRLNRLALLAGGLGGSLSATGSSLLAMSQEEVGIEWKEVRKITVDEKRLVLSVHNSWRTVFRLYCLPGNYAQALEYVKRYIPADRIVYRSRIAGLPP